MNELMNAALAGDPMAFKKEFSTAMQSRIDNLKAQCRDDIAQSVDVTEDDINAAFGDETAFDDNKGN